MDSRFSFVSLFIDKGDSIILGNKSYLKMRDQFKYWKELGFDIKINNIDPSINRFVYFYKNRFFSKSIKHCDVFEYVIVPSLANPRWLILNKKNAIKRHGLIIKPSSMTAVFVWEIAKILNYLKLFTFIFPHRIVSSFPLCNGFDLDNKLSPSILYTGAPGKYQKFTVQCVDESYAPTSFLKLANTVSGISRIKNERVALTCLNKVNFKEIKIPLLIRGFNYKNFYGIIQENILNMDNMSMNFSEVDELVIEDLYRNFEHQIISTNEFLFELKDSIDELYIGNKITLALDKELILTVSHGDYLPWNRFNEGRVSKVIDWEMFGFRPIFYDLFYFILHESCLVKKHGAISAINSSLEIIKRMLIRGSLPLYQHIETIELHLLMSYVLIFSHYSKNKSDRDCIFLNEIKLGVEYLCAQQKGM
jgi:hypothetical protein